MATASATVVVALATIIKDGSGHVGKEAGNGPSKDSAYSINKDCGKTLW